MFKAKLNQFIGNLIYTLNPTRKAYRSVFINELPEQMEDRIVYLLGEGKHLWSAAMKCPCGCNDLLQLSLHKESKPKWSVIWHLKGTVSLHPSIWRKTGCKSHFFVKNGHIIWV